MTTGDSAAASVAADARDPIEIVDGEFAAQFDALYAPTWGDGAIPARYKELAGVSLSVVVRCTPCLVWHTKSALLHGATRQQVIEALRIGLLSGGSAGIPTAREGYRLLIDTPQ